MIGDVIDAVSGLLYGYAHACLWVGLQARNALLAGGASGQVAEGVAVAVAMIIGLAPLVITSRLVRGRWCATDL